MGALAPFTSTLHLRGDRLTSQGKQHHRLPVGNRAPLRISCSKPTSTGVDNAAEVNERASTTKRKQRAHDEGTPQSRPGTAKAAATKPDAARDAADMTKLQEFQAESEWDVYCDVLPDSSDCQKLLHLTPSWPIRELEVESSEFMIHGSKKPQRLASTSWDLLD